MESNATKIIFAILAAVVLFSPAAYAASNELTIGNIVLRNESYYTPFPVEPGSYFDFFASIKNIGRNPTTVSCGIDPKFPFSIDAGQENYRTFTDLADAKEAIMKFHIRVDDSAVEGDNNLDITCVYPDIGQTNTAQYKIAVQAKASTVNIESVSVFPLQIQPGQKGIVTVRVKSASPNYLRDFKINLGIGADTMPFAVVNGTNERLVSQIDPFESVAFSFELMAYPSAAAGVYKLPLTITYSDKLGRAYSISQFSGLVVGSTPKLEVAAESTTISRAGSTGKVLVRIMNRGLTSVKTLQVKLLPSKDYVILSSASQYIGAINADDFETAEFRVHVSENATSPVSFSTVLEYTDTSNAAYTQVAAATLPLFTQVEAIQYGLETIPDNTLTYIILLLVVLYLVYKFVLPAISGFYSEYFGKQKGKKD